jgi:hypothetical protein
MDDTAKFERAAPQLAHEFEEKVNELVGAPRAPSVRGIEEACELLDGFQEMPQILDNGLELVVKKLANRFLDTNETWPFRILYTLCKVRGNKVVSRFFPNDGELGSFLFVPALYNMAISSIVLV